MGELHNLDKQIGRLVQGIDALGVSQDTLILAIGDNGAPNDALNTLLRRNGGLRTGKGNLYEGGIREPFIIRWPGTVPAGVVNSNTITLWTCCRPGARWPGFRYPTPRSLART